MIQQGDTLTCTHDVARLGLFLALLLPFVRRDFAERFLLALAHAIRGKRSRGKLQAKAARVEGRLTPAG